MDRIDRHAGTAATITALGGILLAIWLDPSFRWTSDALSHLGVRTESALVFNGSLMIAGGFGAWYGLGIVGSTRSRRRRLAGGVFVLSALSLAGVGLFVTGHPLHLPSAIEFYVLATVAILTDGIHRRNETTGRIGVVLAMGQIAIWVTWMAGGWPGDGIALPEFVGAVVLATWILIVSPEPSLGGLGLSTCRRNFQSDPPG